MGSGWLCCGSHLAYVCQSHFPQFLILTLILILFPYNPVPMNATVRYLLVILGLVVSMSKSALVYSSLNSFDTIDFYTLHPLIHTRVLWSSNLALKPQEPSIWLRRRRLLGLNP